MKPPKTRNTGRWTEARWRSFVISALRSATMRWGPKYDALKRAYVSRGVSPETGRPCKLHRCALCNGLFPQTHMKVDHVTPVVDPVKGFQSWDSYIERMFCEVSGFQVLCEGCHQEKTEVERLSRRGIKHTPAVRSRR